jgi:hypothetical protein
MDDPSKPLEVTLLLDVQNYSEQQREAMAQAFRQHGFKAQALGYERRTIEELPAYIRIILEGGLLGLGFGGAHLAKKFLDQAYDEWLRPVLNDTLFKSRNKKTAPTLEIEAEEATFTVRPENKLELAAALELLGEVVESGDSLCASTGSQQFTYRDGTWEIWPDILQPEAYLYDPSTKDFTKIEK